MKQWTWILFFWMVFGQGSISIPPTHPGLIKGGTYQSAAQVKIEVFVDLLCPDSRDAYSVLSTLQGQYPRDVELVIHPYSLPYHKHAFEFMVGAYAVQKYCPALVFDYISLVFSVLDSYSDFATLNTTSNEIVDATVNLASKVGCKADLRPHLQPGSDLNRYTRLQWKYGAARGVSGTPFVFVNGVYYGNQANTLEHWKKVVDSVIGNHVLTFQ